jgi:hypothetical protein
LGCRREYPSSTARVKPGPGVVEEEKRRRGRGGMGYLYTTKAGDFADWGPKVTRLLHVKSDVASPELQENIFLG